MKRRIRRRRSDPVGIGSLVGRWVRRNHFDERVLVCSMAMRWEQLVGPRVAQRTRPVKLADGVLTLKVANSTWLNELTFLKEQLLAQLNAELEGAPLKTLRLSLGSLAALPTGPTSRVRRRPPVIPVALERWQGAMVQASRELPSTTDEDLDDAIRRARAAQIARDEQVAHDEA